MARQLSTKVEHCPKCRKLKSKVGPCKSCGYTDNKVVAETHKAYTIQGLDASKLTSISINGVTFKRCK